MLLTRRYFIGGTAALFASTSLPALGKPRLPGIAFVVGDDWRGSEVVWANSAREALDWAFGYCTDDCQRFVGGHSCDECNTTDCERAPIFDGFRETGVPIHAYHRAGWKMPCVRCEANGVYEHAQGADDKCAEDWSPVPTRDGGFEVVCHDDMTIDENLAIGRMDRADALEWKCEFWDWPMGALSERIHGA